jgi:hypothetical protein
LITNDSPVILDLGEHVWVRRASVARKVSWVASGFFARNAGLASVRLVDEDGKAVAGASTADGSGCWK